MANITNIAPHVAGFSFGQIIIDTISDFKAARVRRAVYNATFQALSDMTDKDGDIVVYLDNRIFKVFER